MSLPKEFTDMLAALPGTETLAETLENTQPDISLRINPARPAFTMPEITDTVPWYSGGRYLGSRPNFTLIPQLHSGCFYVQDASSMAVASVLRQIVRAAGDTPLVYLDACAAPGGKTTAAMDVLPAGSLVVANEFDPKRMRALVENITRWGYTDIIVTRGDAGKLGRCREMFDVIATDMPCSGEGMMRKEPEAVRQWSRALVRDCAATQRRIAGELLPALRPGGYMIYSTCTFNTSENEDNVLYFMENYGMEPVPIEVFAGNADIQPGFAPENPALGNACARFYPGRIRGEGQFVALLRKPGETVRRDISAGKGKVSAQVSCLVNPEKYTITEKNGTLTAFPTAYMRQLKEISKAAHIEMAGIELGQQKGKDFIPSHRLALSVALAADAYPAVALSHEEALSYLRGNPPVLPDGTPRGIVLLTHGGYPLGFAKNIGNRANTLLPSQHRILKG